MPRTRRDVWKLTQPWDDVLLWYARGVGELRLRPVAKVSSWTFLAGMHGFDQELWTAFGYLSPGDPLPAPADRMKFWEQCQHQTWYFLPWHRGYLAAFESAVRGAIIDLGGPSDWALPYWNYSDSSDPNALKLPPAFSEQHLPNGNPNPLAEKRRYGDGTGNVVIRAEDVGLNALKELHFEGSTSGGSTGFGGIRTAFSHGGQASANGRVERQPHNIVHGLIGGRDPAGDPDNGESYGLMSMPDTAGLDPIFWLHHANIDRLWDVWLRRNAQNVNPTDPAWLTGPADRQFAVPWPDGSSWTFSASDVLDTETPPLGYSYESTADPFGGADLVGRRLERLGASPRDAALINREPAMAQPRAELVGANEETVRLEGDAAETRLRVDQEVAGRTMRGLRMERDAVAADAVVPDRVFLNLENIHGVNDAAVFYVYVSHPSARVPETMVGAVSLFGVRKASESARGGNGINESLDITDWVDQLRAAGVQDLDDLKIRLVPRTPIRPEDKISVGRISVYRQGR